MNRTTCWSKWYFCSRHEHGSKKKKKRTRDRSRERPQKSHRGRSHDKRASSSVGGSESDGRRRTSSTDQNEPHGKSERRVRCQSRHEESLECSYSLEDSQSSTLPPPRTSLTVDGGRSEDNIRKPKSCLDPKQVSYLHLPYLLPSAKVSSPFRNNARRCCLSRKQRTSSEIP